MFSRFPVGRTLPIENPFVWREPDYVLTNKHPGGVLAFYPSPRAMSFCVLYGEVVPRCAVDLQVAISVFADIDQPNLAREVGLYIRKTGCLRAKLSAVHVGA